MLAVMPGLAIGAGDLMVAFLLMSGLAMLIVVLASWLFVVSINVAVTSRAIDAGIAVVSFVLSKVWMAALLPVLALGNCVGGGAVSVIAVASMFGKKPEGVATLALALIAAVIGAVSLSGSVTAWTRLSGMIKRPPGIMGRQILGLVFMVMVLAVGGCIVFIAAQGTGELIAASGLIYGLLGCALIAGILVTLPIQQAQMPVVLHFCNAFIALAIGLEGFIPGSLWLMIAGLLVFTARILLTLPIARAPVIEAYGPYGDTTTTLAD